MAASVPPITIISPGRLTKDWRSPPIKIETTIKESPQMIPVKDALSKVQPFFMKKFNKSIFSEFTTSPHFLQYFRLVSKSSQLKNISEQ